MTGNNIATLYDLRGKNNIECEINKNDKQQDYIEFRIKDKNGDWIKSYINITELYGLIWLLVDKEQQQELMPVRQTEVRTYQGQHRIKLKRDMKKGEIVVANYHFEVPIKVEENIRALMGKKYQKPSGILIPSRIR